MTGIITIIVETFILAVLTVLVAVLLLSDVPYVAVPFIGCAVLCGFLLFTDVRTYRNARMRNLRK